MKKQHILQELKRLFEWVNSRYADEADRIPPQDVGELRLRLESIIRQLV